MFVGVHEQDQGHSGAAVHGRQRFLQPCRGLKGRQPCCWVPGYTKRLRGFVGFLGMIKEYLQACRPAGQGRQWRSTKAPCHIVLEPFFTSLPLGSDCYWHTVSSRRFG